MASDHRPDTGEVFSRGLQQALGERKRVRSSLVAPPDVCGAYAGNDTVSLISASPADILASSSKIDRKFGARCWRSMVYTGLRETRCTRFFALADSSAGFPSDQCLDRGFARPR